MNGIHLPQLRADLGRILAEPVMHCRHHSSASQRRDLGTESTQKLNSSPVDCAQGIQYACTGEALRHDHAGQPHLQDEVDVTRVERPMLLYVKPSDAIAVRDSPNLEASAEKRGMRAVSRPRFWASWEGTAEQYVPTSLRLRHCAVACLPPATLTASGRAPRTQGRRPLSSSWRSESHKIRVLNREANDRL